MTPEINAIDQIVSFHAGEVDADAAEASIQEAESTYRPVLLGALEVLENPNEAQRSHILDKLGAWYEDVWQDDSCPNLGVTIGGLYDILEVE